MCAYCASCLRRVSLRCAYRAARSRLSSALDSHMHLPLLGFRRLSIASVAVVLGGCVLNRHSSQPFDGCWTDNPPTDYIVRAAANSIIGDSGSGGRRIRTLSAVPLNLDSIRAHSELVTDPAICRRAWKALRLSDRGSRAAVIQIGRTYWVRYPGGYQAFDDHFRLLASIVDL